MSDHTYCATCNDPEYDFLVDGHEPVAEAPTLTLNRAMLDELIARAQSDGFKRGYAARRGDEQRKTGATS